jgi:hypothetical protein
MWQNCLPELAAGSLENHAVSRKPCHFRKMPVTPGAFVVLSSEPPEVSGGSADHSRRFVHFVEFVVSEKSWNHEKH